MTNNLLEYLFSFLTDNRRELFLRVIEKRTRYLTVVLEDIYQSQNASAVLRTCDCFGIQDVHVIENTNQFNVNPKVVRGATKWLTLHHYNERANNTTNALNTLKANGYRIIATSPYANDVDLNDFDLSDGKTALVFGTELQGISKDVMDNADGFIKIPMNGFTESFNISVSVAIILHHLTFKMNKLGINYQLSEKEKDELMLEWLRRSIKGSDLLIEKFLNRN